MKLVRSCIICTALALTSCGDDLVEPQFTGTYHLVSVAGGPLPAKRGTIPERDGGFSGCHAEITVGEFSRTSQGFYYFYELRNSCTSALLSKSELSGAIQITGQNVDLIITRVDGDVRQPSVFRRDTVIVLGDSLVFARR